MFPFEKTAVGDFAVSWKLAETISVETSRRVLCCYQALRESKNPVLKQITDIVPTYLSVTVYFREAGNDEIQKAVALTDEFFSRLDMNSADNGKGSVLTVEFPVVYNGADLERVAEIHGISVESVLRPPRNPASPPISFRPRNVMRNPPTSSPIPLSISEKAVDRKPPSSA